MSMDWVGEQQGSRHKLGPVESSDLYLVRDMSYALNRRGEKPSIVSH